jgi:cytochrome P450
MEVVLVLATIAQKFEFGLAEGREIKPRPSITLRPDKGVRMVIGLW